MTRNRVLQMSVWLLLGGCCADAGPFCEDEYDSMCVQEAFATQSSCGTASSESVTNGCSTEFDAYLACLDTAMDCGSCAALETNWRECSATDASVCNYYSRIDRGCFADRPDCGPVIEENVDPSCTPLWRVLMHCFATKSPADGDCVSQCMPESLDFFGC